ncbi:hypothetical protein JCM10207_006261 [Rhodosporidiobolus poonsookiae]
MPRTLPHTCVDLILSQDVLSDADLARCALVSPGFRDLSQRWLHRHLPIELGRDLDANDDEVPLLFTEWSWSQFKLVREQPRLARFVRRVSLTEATEDATYTDARREWTGALAEALTYVCAATSPKVDLFPLPPIRSLRISLDEHEPDDVPSLLLKSLSASAHRDVLRSLIIPLANLSCEPFSLSIFRNLPRTPTTILLGIDRITAALGIKFVERRADDPVFTD